MGNRAEEDIKLGVAEVAMAEARLGRPMHPMTRAAFALKLVEAAGITREFDKQMKMIRVPSGGSS